MTVDEGKATEKEQAERANHEGAAPVAGEGRNRGRRSPEDRTLDGDVDDETWTNQPAQARAGSAVSSDDEDLGAEDEDDFEDELPPTPRKPIQNGRDVICEELPVRASRAKLRLHSYLKAALVVELSNSGERFLFDWQGDEPKVTVYESKEEISFSDTATGIDSFVSVSDQNIMAIRSGDLNPQVAMLADKIKVKGKMSPAVYLFNLIAPRVRD